MSCWGKSNVDGYFRISDCATSIFDFWLQYNSDGLTFNKMKTKVCNLIKLWFSKINLCLSLSCKMIFSRLALMSILVSYTLAYVGKECIDYRQCQPDEKCIKISTSSKKKHCVGPVSPWPTNPKTCTRNRDCDLWRFEMCIFGSCMTLAEYLGK